MDTESLHILFIKKYYFKFSSNQYHEIKSKYKDLESAYKGKYKNLEPSKFKTKLENLSETDFNSINQTIKICKEKNIQIITFLDSNFPKILLEADPEPLVLFYQGDINLINDTKNNIAIVGSRKITPYAKKIIDNIVPKLSGVNIVSGLAYGVDCFSQEKGVYNGIPNIAVIGGGLIDEVFYPKANLNLKNLIVEQGGLVISQFFPNQKCYPFHFPIRNQLVVLLAKLVWVVQAKIKSGSFITAKLAYEYGVDIATTPNNIFDKDFNGNTKLIKDGSLIISDIDDINDIFGLKHHDGIKNDVILFGDKNIIYQSLINSEKSLDELENCIGEKLENNLLITISDMELEGLIKIDDMGNYSVS